MMLTSFFDERESPFPSFPRRREFSLFKFSQTLALGGVTGKDNSQSSPIKTIAPCGAPPSIQSHW